MLCIPQEDIGINQHLVLRLTDLIPVSQQGQDLKDRANLQLFFCTTTHQLKGLPDKLNLTDTTRPQLDIIQHPLFTHLTSDHQLHLTQ